MSILLLGSVTRYRPLDFLSFGLLFVSMISPTPSFGESVPIRRQGGGTYQITAVLNGTLRVDCILDTGASDFSLPPSVAKKLLRSGSLTDADYLGTRTYGIADGSSMEAVVVRLRTVRLGTTVVSDVVASISKNENSPILLGQSVLSKFPSWKIDNTTSRLIIGDPGFSVANTPADQRGPRTTTDGSDSSTPCPPNYCKRLNGTEYSSCLQECATRRRNSR